MIASPVDENQQRLTGVAPVHVVELEALGVIVVRGRSDDMWSRHAISFLVQNCTGEKRRGSTT
jgi:hypothetical protein